MTDREIVREIERLKKERDAVILVHNYQNEEVQLIADYLGDSLELSRIARDTKNKTIVFCGVDFMAQTAKILSPEKTVLIPVKDATCPMANMVKPEDIDELRSKYPDAKIVCYVNTTADVKARCDVCCTSANALKVVQNIGAKRIVFVPDRNLGHYVSRFTDKEVILFDGYCNVHERITKDEVLAAKKKRGDLPVVSHPECKPDVIDISDEVASTSGMIKLAKRDDIPGMLVATEEGLIRRLRREFEGKEFFSAGSPKVCVNMKKTRLIDVYNALKENRYKVELGADIINKSRRSLDEMLKYI